jgi:hypothetical protein
LDPTPIVHQIVEAEAELFISGVFNRDPIFFLKDRLTATPYSRFARGPSWTPIHTPLRRGSFIGFMPQFV